MSSRLLEESTNLNLLMDFDPSRDKKPLILDAHELDMITLSKKGTI